MPEELNRRDFFTGVIAASSSLIVGCADSGENSSTVDHSITSPKLTTERQNRTRDENTKTETTNDVSSTASDDMPPLSDTAIEIHAMLINDLSDTQLQWLDLMRPSELPPKQGEILQKAIKKGTISKESPWPDSWNRFVKTVIETRSSQIERYRDEHSTHKYPTYLDGVHAESQSNYYCLEVRREDEFASTCFI